MFHLHAHNISRQQGHSAVRAAAYRAGARMTDQRLEEEHNFTLKRGVLYSEMKMPFGFRSKAETFWNALERAEDDSTRWRTAVLAKEFNLALPHGEVFKEDHVPMVHEWVHENFTRKRLAAQISIHAGHKADGFKNIHAHVMVATRTINSDRTFGNKDRALREKATLYQWRESWERILNKYLERHNEQEVSARSFADRGIDRIPTVHVGRGKDAERRREHNEIVRSLNQEKATLEKYIWVMTLVNNELIRLEKLKVEGHEFDPVDVKREEDLANRPQPAVAAHVQKEQRLREPTPAPNVEPLLKPELAPNHKKERGPERGGGRGF